MSIFSKRFNPSPNRKQRRQLKENIKITGIVRIIQGEKVVVEARNHFVNQGLMALISLLCISYHGHASYAPAREWTTTRAYCGIRLGSDTTTPTAAIMEDLISALGGWASSASLSRSNPSPGVYQVTYTSTWNAGAVSGTIGEVGLFLYIWDTLQPAGGNSLTPSKRLASRLSVADGDFTAYTIDTALPLTVQWIIQFSFA
ncbi:MAG: hypothetical protein ACE5JA_08050 [bacterium]